MVRCLTRTSCAGIGLVTAEHGQKPPTVQDRVFKEIHALLSLTQDSTVEIGAALEAKVVSTQNKKPETSALTLMPRNVFCGCCTMPGRQSERNIS